jgi:hypothetical protein
MDGSNRNKEPAADMKRYLQKVYGSKGHKKVQKYAKILTSEKKFNVNDLKEKYLSENGSCKNDSRIMESSDTSID